MSMPAVNFCAFAYWECEPCCEHIHCLAEGCMICICRSVGNITMFHIHLSVCSVKEIKRERRKLQEESRYIKRQRPDTYGTCKMIHYWQADIIKVF